MIHHSEADTEPGISDLDFSSENISFRDKLLQKIIQGSKNDEIVALDDDAFLELNAAGSGYRFKDKEEQK
jgi:hypothetical protein